MQPDAATAPSSVSRRNRSRYRLSCSTPGTRGQVLEHLYGSLTCPGSGGQVAIGATDLPVIANRQIDGIVSIAARSLGSWRRVTLPFGTDRLDGWPSSVSSRSASPIDSTCAASSLGSMYAEGWSLGIHWGTVSQQLQSAGITMRLSGPPAYPASTQQIPS